MMKGQEAEQQLNKLAKHRLKTAVDGARDTEGSTGQEDKTHTSGEIFIATDGAMPSVVGNGKRSSAATSPSHSSHHLGIDHQITVGANEIGGWDGEDETVSQYLLYSAVLSWNENHLSATRTKSSGWYGERLRRIYSSQAEDAWLICVRRLSPYLHSV